MNTTSWTIKTCTYTGMSGMAVNPLDYSGHAGSLYYTQNTGVNPNGSNWFRGMTLTSNETLDSSSFSLDFFVDNARAASIPYTFGDFNGYNGCLSFVLYSNSTFSEESETAFPENLHYNNYTPIIEAIMNSDYRYKAGGLGSRLHESNGVGISFTLYPCSCDETSLPFGANDSNTNIVRFYRLFIKHSNFAPPIFTQGYIDPVNLGINRSGSIIHYIPNISLVRNSNDNSNSILINGTQIEKFFSQNDIIYNMNNCKLAIFAQGAWNSAINITLDSFC